MTAPSLRELQRRLRELIFTHVEGHAETRARLDSAAREIAIRGDDRLSAGERVLVYGRMHLARIREAIGEDFPALLRALGQERFDMLIRAYLRAHPTDDCSLRRAARHLPRFLDEHPELACFAAQADLARLEWAMIEAFDGADDTPLSRDEIAALPAHDWPELVLRPIRALVLLDLAHPVDELRAELIGQPAPDHSVTRTRRAGNEGRAPVEPEAPSVRLRVWRQSLRVFLRRMSSLEADALLRLRADPSFSALCDWIADRPGEDDPAARAAGLLDLWLRDELLQTRLPTPASGAT